MPPSLQGNGHGPGAGTAFDGSFDVGEHLVDLVWRLGHWSYLVLFLGATLESAAFLGLLVPGDTVAILAGVLASAGVLDLPETIVVAAVGAALGDSIGYELGRRLGRPWLVRHGHRFGFHRPRLERLDRLFERHGGKTVLFGRLVGFLRAMAPFVAGSSRMPYGRFLVFNVAGAVVWPLGFVLIGYVLGSSWQAAERWIGRVGLVLGTLAITAAVIWLSRRHRAVRAE
jgi:undecaprenyl-diphosphatase